MECPDCGYIYSPFEQNCSRCAKLGKPVLTPAASSVITAKRSGKLYAVMFCIVLFAIAGGIGIGFYAAHREQSFPATPTNPTSNHRPPETQTAHNNLPAANTPPVVIDRPTAQIPNLPIQPLQTQQTNVPQVRSNESGAQSTMPAVSNGKPETSPTEPDVNSLTNSLLQAAQPVIREQTSRLTTGDDMYTSTNIDKTTSLTSPYMGYVILTLKTNLHSADGKERYVIRITHQFAFQNGTWVYKGRMLVMGCPLQNIGNENPSSIILPDRIALA